MVRLHDLGLRHDGHVAVDGLSGTFPPGSLTAVLGPNGGGKTTLLRALAGLHRPYRGCIDRGGLRPDRIGYLAQAPSLDRSFPIACLDVVVLALAARLGWLCPPRPAHIQAAQDALAAVGLAGLQKRPIGGLSAGQFQRLMFARALAQDAPLVLLDEPFNAVDEPTAADLLAVIQSWHRDGRTVVVVLHDLLLAQRHFPLALLLARTPIAWGPAAEVLTPDNLRRAGLAVAEPADRPAAYA